MSFTVVLLRAILGAAEQQGLARAKAIAAATWSPAEIDDVTMLVGEVEFVGMLDELVALGDDPFLGLTLGSLCAEHSLNLFGQVLLASPCLRDAAAVLEELGPTMIGGPSIQLFSDSGSARFQLAARPNSLASRFIGEFLLAIICRMALRFAASSPDLVRSVHFASARPSYAPYPNLVLGVPTSFGHREYALVFAAELLDKTVPGTHPHAVLALRRLAHEEIVAPRASRSWKSRVGTVLKRTTELAHVDFTLVARELGVTLRTLRRRVQAEGTTLSEVLNGARVERAMSQLGCPEESIKFVAEQLGYAEPSSFHRAFKRWTGITPAAYRRGALSPLLDEPADTIKS